MAKKARAKAVVPADETKSQKFARLASKRVGKALKAIGLISNLSNRSGYDYTPEQIDKIAVALSEKVNATMSNFNPNAKADTSDNFEL